MTEVRDFSIPLRLKNTIKKIQSGFWGEEPDGVNDIICLRVADFNRDNFTINDSKLTLRSISHKDRIPRLVKHGDLLIEKSGGGENQPVGTVAYYNKDYEAVSSNFLSLLRPDNTQNGRFLCYLFASLYAARINTKSIKQTTGIQNLDLESYLNEKAIIPPLSIQKAIATFLDKETTRIDSLIEKKSRQIELLQEKRQAVITRAITKGLDPNTKMKDSGIEWIGKIPEGWEVKKLRYLGICQNGISKDGDSFGTGYPFVSYGDVYHNYALPILVEGRVESSEQDRKNYSVEEGDVLFTRTSETVEEIGFASTCMKTIHNAVFAGFVIRFRPKPLLLVKSFSKYFFRANIHRSYFVKEMNIVTRTSLSQDLLKNLPVLLPPKKEMENIGKYLDDENNRIDSLQKKIRESISLLQEYRSSLITDAVSGQIDVSKGVSK